MNKLPVTVVRSIELLGLFLVGALVKLGADIIMPLLISILLSVLLMPVHRFFRRHKFSEGLSVAISLMLLLVLLALVIWFFTHQVNNLIANFPQIQKNVAFHLNNLSGWIKDTTHITTRQQIQFINDQSNKLLTFAGTLLGQTATSVTTAIAYFGLIPIYIFLVLLYKNLLLRFIFLWFTEKQHDKVKETLHAAESIIKSYLFGLLIQITYMTFLLGGTLWIIGIANALLIGVIFAMLNLIPYIGALIGTIIAVILTISSTQALWPILAVLGTIAVVQFLDNNILMPRIVGSKVQVNALATIVGVLTGGAIAGIPGMFLSLPVLATLKVICERTEKFYHWSVLLGEDVLKTSPQKLSKLTHKNIHVKSEPGDRKDAQMPMP